MLNITLSILVLAGLAGCAQMKKMEEKMADDMKTPEIMSADDQEQYFKTKVVDSLPELRKCVNNTGREKVVKFNFLIEDGRVTKSEAHSLQLDNSEKACLTKTAGSIDFMMLKNYSAQQTLKFYPAGK